MTAAAAFEKELHELLLQVSRGTACCGAAPDGTIAPQGGQKEMAPEEYQCAVLPGTEALGGQPYQMALDGTTLVLGVDAAALKQMLISVRDTAPQRVTQLAERIPTNNVSSSNSSGEEHTDAALDLLRATNLLLLGAPMNYHWWNKRKQAVLSATTSSSSSTLAAAVYEMHFTALLLSKYPKLGDVWFQRRLVLSKGVMCATTAVASVDDDGRGWWITLGAESKAAWLRREWRLVAWCSEQHPRNYAAWQHCAWLCSNVTGDDELHRAQLFESAIAHYERFVSDPSAGQFIVSALHELLMAGKDLHQVREWTRRLLAVNNRMLRMHADHGHDGLWTVRRGIVTIAAAVDGGCLGSWSLEEELTFAAAHMEIVVDDGVGDLKSLADSSGTPQWHSYNAAKYGMWLVKGVALKKVTAVV